MAGNKEELHGDVQLFFCFTGNLICSTVFFFAEKYGKLIIIRPGAVLLWYFAVLVERFVDSELYILFVLGVLCYDVFKFPGRT